jgi:uncharacterized membrane protein YtjA (UPF0391 family)
LPTGGGALDIDLRRVNAEFVELFPRWNLEHSVPPDVDGANSIETRSNAMLGWALTFLIVALIAAVLGFGGIAGFAVEIAKIIFFVAIILFVISPSLASCEAARPPSPSRASANPLRRV